MTCKRRHGYTPGISTRELDSFWISVVLIWTAGGVRIMAHVNEILKVRVRTVCSVRASSNIYNLLICNGLGYKTEYVFYFACVFPDLSPASNIYRHIGETIEVYCVLDQWAVDKGLSSANLSFSSPKFNITKKHVNVSGVNVIVSLSREENSNEKIVIASCSRFTSQ